MHNTLAFIGTLGAQEMMLIFLVILLLFGAKKLPDLARGIGKSMGEFKKAREEFEHEITRAETETSKPKPKPAPRRESTREKQADQDVVTTKETDDDDRVASAKATEDSESTTKDG